MTSFQVLSCAGEMSFHTQGRSSFMRKRVILQQQRGGSGRGRLDWAAHEARLWADNESQDSSFRSWQGWVHVRRRFAAQKVPDSGAYPLRTRQGSQGGRLPPRSFCIIFNRAYSSSVWRWSEGGVSYPQIFTNFHKSDLWTMGNVDLWTMGNVANVQCCQFSVPISNWPMPRLLREIGNWQHWYWQHYRIGNIKTTALFNSLAEMIYKLGVCLSI